jgi:hypothetical protein
MIKKSTLLLSLIAIHSVHSYAYAGLNKLTFHSRANCLSFNETVSWDATRKWYLYTYAEHRHLNSKTNSWDEVHEVYDGPSITWRSAAYHFNEGYGGWFVSGMHYFGEEDDQFELRIDIKNSGTEDCSIYDGWWDFSSDDTQENPKEKNYKQNQKIIKLSSKIHNIKPKTVSFISEKEIFPEEMVNKSNLKRKDMKEKGYHESDSNKMYLKYLLSLKNRAPKEISDNKNNKNPYDTHLKASLKEIKLAFKFKQPPIEQSAIIGYAAGNTYQDGWTGIAVFFVEGESTCSYEYDDLSLSNGAIMILKERTTYEINNKPTIISVIGNHKNGFVYKAVWNNKLQKHKLSCANSSYKKSITDYVLKKAIDIDNSASSQ